MKVVLINGSPNEKGCTFTALEEVGSALAESGISTEIIHVGGGAISGCTGCGACTRNANRCVLPDGKVNQALDSMDTASGLVVGTPVYFASPNGALLSFMDRLFMAGRAFTRKPAAAIASARRAGTTASLDAIHKYYSLAGMPIVSANYYNVIHGHTPDETRQDLEGMQTMRVLGRNMAWLLQSIQAGAAAGVQLPVAEAKIKTSYIR